MGGGGWVVAATYRGYDTTRGEVTGVDVSDGDSRGGVGVMGWELGALVMKRPKEE